MSEKSDSYSQSPMQSTNKYSHTDNACPHTDGGRKSDSNRNSQQKCGCERNSLGNGHK